MAGQLIPRGPRTWVVRVSLGRDGTGKRRYLSRTVHGTKRDAEQCLHAALRERDLGTLVAAHGLTLDTYLDRWLAAKGQGGVRARTYEDYAAVLRRYMRPVLGARRLAQLQPLELQELYTGMSARGLSPRTVRYLHAIVSAALKQAVRWRLLAQNVAAFVDLPRMRRREAQVIAPEDVGRFLAAAADDPFGIVLTFALATGMRPGEYLGLQWKDLDLQRGVAVVQRAVVWRSGRWYFAEPKTARSRRTVPLPASLTRTLIEHRRRQSAERLAAGPQYTAHDLVFATGAGTPLDLRNLSQRHFKAVVRRAGLSETLRLYDLRHTSATLLLAAGEHPKVVSERLGHATVTLTLDTYSHVLPTMQQGAADRLETLLFGSA
jgi:integrase